MTDINKCSSIKILLSSHLVIELVSYIKNSGYFCSQDSFLSLIVIFKIGYNKILESKRILTLLF